MLLEPAQLRAALERSRGRVSAVSDRMQRRLVSGGHIPRDVDPPPGIQPRDAAVLALLYPHQDQLTMILTERAMHLGRHSGQISFPGGGRDPSDATLWETALRETREEVGAHLPDAEPWAQLEPIYVSVSNYRVTGYVSFTPTRPRFVASPDEVAALIEVPLAHLLSGGSFSTAERDYQDRRVLEGHFRYGERRIWGATALLIDQILHRITRGLAE